MEKMNNLPKHHGPGPPGPIELHRLKAGQTACLYPENFV